MAVFEQNLPHRKTFSCARMRNLFAEKFISDFIALGGFQSKHDHALNVTNCSGNRNCFNISRNFYIFTDL